MWNTVQPVAMLSSLGDYKCPLSVVDPKNDSKLTFDGRGVTVPQGKPVAMKQFSSSRFWQSEYLVYQESQVRIRYLLTFRR